MYARVYIYVCAYVKRSWSRLTFYFAALFSSASACIAGMMRLHAPARGSNIANGEQKTETEGKALKQGRITSQALLMLPMQSIMGADSRREAERVSSSAHPRLLGPAEVILVEVYEI